MGDFDFVPEILESLGVNIVAEDIIEVSPTADATTAILMIIEKTISRG